MDDVVNRLARELADAIAAAVADDPRVEACRERARTAGYEMKVSLEATVGFASRQTPGALHQGRAECPCARAAPQYRDERDGSSLSAVASDLRRRIDGTKGSRVAQPCRAA